jgi:hypothetical protein
MGSHSTWNGLIVPHISECWTEEGIIRLKHLFIKWPTNASNYYLFGFLQKKTKKIKTWMHLLVILWIDNKNTQKKQKRTETCGHNKILILIHCFVLTVTSGSLLYVQNSNTMGYFRQKNVKGSKFSRQLKIPQLAFLRKGRKAVCPMSQICGV